MSTFNKILSTLLLIMAAISSCRKTNDNPSTAQIDSIASALPKQIIDNYTFDSLHLGISTVFRTDVISIKYDTINRKIQLYKDDTTTANPYDVLLATYKYNNAGYLTSFAQNNTFYRFKSAIQFTATINRNPDNTISSIVSLPVTGTWMDSVLYTYHSLDDGISILTVNHSYFNQILVNNYAATYYYNADSRLTKIVDQYHDSSAYSYNPNNSFASFSLHSSDVTTQGNFSYSSGLPDGKADVFLQTLLGKDFYIFDLKAFDPFILYVNSDFSDEGISITEPYHPTDVNISTYTPDKPDPFPTSSTWAYQLNTENNVSEMTFKKGFLMHVYTLKY